MRFAAPFALQIGAAITVLVALGLIGHVRRRRKLATFLGGRRAAQRLSGTDLYRWAGERFFLLIASVALISVAASGPLWNAPTEEPPPPPPVHDIMLVIDVSVSMQATDAPPTRLGAAARLAGALLDELEGERVGLILFAGKPYELAPPTFDHDALRYLLRGVTPTIASNWDPGSLPSEAIREAIKIVGQTADSTDIRSIVLMSDGEAGETEGAMLSAVREATRAGVSVNTVGFGTAAGATMEMPTAQFQLNHPILDPSGALAVSHLRTAALRRIAAAGNGEYVRGSDANAAGALSIALVPPVPLLIPVARPSAPIWARYDLGFLLSASALIFLLLESLLGVRRPSLSVPSWLRGTRRLRRTA